MKLNWKYRPNDFLTGSAQFYANGVGSVYFDLWFYPFPSNALHTGPTKHKKLTKYTNPC